MACVRPQTGRVQPVRSHKQKTVYTEFTTSLDQITKSEPGNVADFINVLQTKLDEKLDTPPDTQTIDKLL